MSQTFSLDINLIIGCKSPHLTGNKKKFQNFNVRDNFSAEQRALVLPSLGARSWDKIFACSSEHSHQPF